MIWRATDPEGNEAAKVKYDIVQYLRGAVLDLGCGPQKVFPHVLGVDSCVDTALFGIPIAPDMKIPDCADLSSFEDGRCDAVFSSHLLEHMADPRAALAEWWRVLKVGGYLVLYLPHRDLYPNIGTPGANIDHKHDFVPDDILAHLLDIAVQSGTGLDIVRNEVRDAGTEYSFLLVLQKLEVVEGVDKFRRSYLDQHTEKTVCISRFGGFGDVLQAANLLPQLKREGYHVVFNTTPQGQDILKHDPHIDEWLILDNDLVPNQELPLFWEACARRYTKFVQLSESIEGTLLAMPGRANHGWPDSVRRVELNKNYLQWLSQLAEIRYTSEGRFYPSLEETGRAQAFLQQLRAQANRGKLIGESPTPVFPILWVLSGSSQHKFYPWMDQVIARVMTDLPEAQVIFSGDEACQLLERGWELEPRVHATSGTMGIRDTLTLAQQVACVVGPETGVLNSVAFEKNSKVLFLSHSSKENLSKNWCHTATLEPEATACYPCHRLQYGMKYCHEDPDTGAAMCQVNISPARVWAAIENAYLRWKEAMCHAAF